MASSAASMPFIKNLASSDRRTRTQSLDTLKSFLSTKYAGSSAPAPLSFRDAYKLWTGLFYALWMTDRVPVQQRLCDELAGLPAAVGLPDASTAAWLRAFWATMAQQWTTGIDVLRMDKFLLLVRRVLAAQLTWMAGSGSGSGVEGGDDKTKKKNKKATATMARDKKAKGSNGKKAKAAAAAAAAEACAAKAAGLAVLQDWPLNPEAETPVDDDDDEAEAEVEAETATTESGGNSRKRWPRKRAQTTVHIPVGLTMHVVDIWVDEAEKLGLLGEGEGEGESKTEAEAEADEQPTLARSINALVEALAAHTRAPAVRKHAREALTDERLPWNQKSGDDEGEDEDEDKDADEDEEEEKVAASEAAVEGGGGGLEAQAGDDDEMADGDWDGFND